MAVSHDDIARVAYALFEARGREDGHDIDDWLMAERELIAASSHIVMFLPFLRLKNAHQVAGVEFVPLRDQDKQITASLAAVSGSMLKILSGYIDQHGAPFDDGVVATIPGRGWDMTTADFPTIMWASSLLFLASWSDNDYFHPFGGDSMDSTAFRPVGQAYAGASPVYIAVSARRRAGRSLDGGYEHGEFKFSAPVQVSVSNSPFRRRPGAAQGRGQWETHRTRFRSAGATACPSANVSGVRPSSVGQRPGAAQCCSILNSARKLAIRDPQAPSTSRRVRADARSDFCTLHAID